MSKSSNGKMKTPEDTNVKILRDMAHIPANRHCFDCGQRGPTYVNVTIGSFVCMTCSGLLRGLTPPHRVKSISMASFTADEIQLLKTKGNEYCRKVWLATSTSKDINISSEKDPDRVNLLKNFMSAKYEQKRFFVDPSKLSKTELNEIQEETVRALSSVSQNLTGSSTSSMQKSPSLSSTRSSSSQQSNSSPVLNNLRNNQQSHHQPNRLVNSITLPDIKPLTSLIGSSVQIPSVQMINQIESSKTVGTGVPNPINFINNLQQQTPSVSSKINNQNNILNISPWANSDTNGVLNGGDNNNFNAGESNFADFEAFSRNNDFFAGQNQGQDNNFSIKSNNGISFSQLHVSSGSSMQQPLLPQNNLSGNHHHQPLTNDINSPHQFTTNNGLEDKYAALKDLDSIFKQTANGDGTAAIPTGISSSASLPANLSSSSGSTGTGWFSTSPNQNPFSHQAPVGQPISNGWNGMNGPHNPFFSQGGNSWTSPPVTNNNTTSGMFNSGPSHLNFSPVSSSPLVGQQQQMFPSSISSNSGKPVNPFFTPISNPNNPFL